MADKPISSTAFFLRVVSGSLLIAGTTIGAGMLAIPLVTASAGFIPGLIVTTLVWIFMMITGLYLLEATLWMPDGANFLSIASHFFGRWGKSFVGLFFVFLYYALMVAYFSAGSSLLQFAIQFMTTWYISSELALILFTAIFFTIVAIGPKCIDRANILMSLFMVATWCLLVGAAIGSIKESNLLHINWSYWPWSLPVLFSAFGYHNIIPSLTSYLHRDKRAMQVSIVIGSGIPFVTYAIWQLITIGILPLSVIESTLHSGKPITVAIANCTSDPWVTSFGQFFALFAIVTSVLGVAFSMVDFFGDGLRWKRIGISRIALCSITFIPPMMLAIINPNLFDTALGIAGGFGEAFLNGLFPVALVWVGRYYFRNNPILGKIGSKLIVSIIAFAALFVATVEIADLFFR